MERGAGQGVQVSMTEISCTGDSSPELSEGELVVALKAGDDAAVEYLVRSNFEWMKATADRLLNDIALAEDCTQEALLNALGHIDSFEGRSSLKTWLHRIIVNQCLMKRRTRQRETALRVDALQPKFDEFGCRIEPDWAAVPAPEELLEVEDRRKRVRQAVASLPDDYGVVLALRDLEGLSTREVAEILGLGEANVKVRLHRARLARVARCRHIHPRHRGRRL